MRGWQDRGHPEQEMEISLITALNPEMTPAVKQKPRALHGRVEKKIA
jgi:hypothetical protein